MSADPPGSPPPANGGPAAGPAGTGRDAARALLARARRSRPPAVRSGAGRPAEPEWSGAAPDERDPALLGDAVSALVADRGWARSVQAASLLPRWPQIVGPEIAAHCRPERLERGRLTCVAESTAWATQLRLISGAVLARIGEAVGPEVVTSLTVHGPTSPDWRHGPLRVRGRGPRDTYG